MSKSSSPPKPKRARALPISLNSLPTLSLPPNGTKCQLTSSWTALPLLERWDDISPTSRVFRFGLPDSKQPLNLSTCACILARATNIESSSSSDDDDIVRPYTPISTNEQKGWFDLLVKVYDKGLMSQHLDGLAIGDEVEFKHIDFNVKIQYPFNKARRIGMIAGGTGITPMIQALHAILGDEDNSGVSVSLLYGSRCKDDILGYDLLKDWEQRVGKDRLKVTHVLSHESEDSDWKGERGMIGEELVKKLIPPPSEGSDDVMVFVCGPPPMYTHVCGPRGDQELTGVLKEAGYNAKQVYKF